jgi:hypothetical protein
VAGWLKWLAGPSLLAGSGQLEEGNWAPSLAGLHSKEKKKKHCCVESTYRGRNEQRRQARWSSSGRWPPVRDAATDLGKTAAEVRGFT